jgi:phosphoribosylamine--glycine ligase
MMEEGIFGPAGETILIEEFLVGREMSLHVLTDGVSFQILPMAQDHKRLGDLDTGPNTGGMGAYAPVPFASAGLIHELSDSIVKPTLAAFREEKIDFRGVLFIGLVLTLEGPKVLEFNVRLGDPETQAILPLLETPLVELLLAVRNRELAGVKLKIHENRHVVSIVLAASGYPEKAVMGAVIHGLDQQVTDTVVFHSGTALNGTDTVVSGGRVISVTGWASSLAHARELAYQRAATIRYSGRQLRHDIAARTTLD